MSIIIIIIITVLMKTIYIVKTLANEVLLLLIGWISLNYGLLQNNYNIMLIVRAYIPCPMFIVDFSFFV